jgi:hypothetical protein
MRKLKPFFFAEQVKEVKEIEEIQSVFQENLNIFGGIIKKWDKQITFLVVFTDSTLSLSGFCEPSISSRKKVEQEIDRSPFLA